MGNYFSNLTNKEIDEIYQRQEQDIFIDNSDNNQKGKKDLILLGDFNFWL